MPTTTFSAASMRYYQGGWTSGQARQGFVNGAATRGEITFNFAGTVDVSNIDISQIVLRFTVGTLGGAYTKYLYLHTGSYNGVSVGNYSFSGCYNTSKSKTFSASGNASGFNTLKAYIEGGGTKLGVYTGTDRGSGSGKSYNYDYMNITAMSLEITYTYKKSTGSISAASTGGSATLNITAYNSAYTHKLTWKLGSWSSTTTAAAGAASASCTIPHSALPNATSGTATVTLETLSSSTSLGSNTYSFAVSVPSSVVPSIGSLSVTPVNSGASSTAAGWGLYIQNKTKATAAMNSVSAGSGATITAYSITSSPNYGSGTSSSLTTSLLTAGGTVTFTAKVTDSRGRTATKTASITVQAYAAPVFTATPAIYRCTSNGTRDDIEGTYARLTAAFSFSSVNSKNSLTVKRVALNGVNTNLTSGTAVTIGAGALAVDNSYSAVFTLTVPSAAYVIHIRKGGKSVGIGKAAPVTNNKLEIAWPTDIAGNMNITGSAGVTGALTVSGNSTVGGTTVCNNDYTRKQTAVDGSAADNGVSSNVYPGFVVRDKDSDWFAAFRARVNTDGGLGAEIRVRNYINSAWSEICALRCMYSKAGAVSYYVQDKAAFQDAIGLKYTNNTAWKDAPVGLTHYRYESTTAASDYDLPHNYVHVLVLKYSGTRGVALAYRWSNSGSNARNTGCQWMNILHGSTWTGWVQTSYTFAQADTAIGEWTDGKTLYRYCCSGTTSSTGDVTTSAALPRTPSDIVSIRGAFQRTTNDGTWRPITFHSYAVAQHAFSAVVSSDNKIHLYIGSSMTGTKKWNLVIEYTA